MRRRAALLAVFSAVVLAACGSGGGGSSTDPYVIGYVNGMSGGYTTYGQYTLAYLKAAVQQANDSGGVNGREIEIRTLDSAAVGQNATSATVQMITRKHPDLLYGVTLSQDCIAISPIAAKYRTPVICGSGAAEVVSPVQKYVFASFALEPALAQPAVGFAADTLKAHSYAVMNGSAGGSVAFGKAIDTAAGAAGMRKAARELVDSTAVSTDPQVAEVVSAHPDVVFLDLVGPQMLATVKALRAAHVRAPVVVVYASIGYDGFTELADPQFYEVAQTPMVTAGLAAKNTGVAQVRKILSAAGMSDPATQNQSLGAQAILPALGAVQALKDCGKPCSPANLAGALESVRLDLPGFVKDYGWTPDRHVPITNADVVTFDPKTKGPVTVATGLPVG